MCLLISIVVYNLFRATMVMNSTTMLLTPSFLNKAFIFVFLAPIHPGKIARLNESFGPSIISCAPCYFKHQCRLHTGLNPFTLSLIFLIYTPTKTLQNQTPDQVLFGTPPTYDHLRIFGCCCYPNLSATMPYKLDPRSAECVLLGFSKNHKGYRCLDLYKQCHHLSSHVV